MKLILDLPEWALQGQRITIFAGTELVAYKEHANRLQVKIGRCSQCGGCCNGWDHGDGIIDPDVDGICRHLKKEVGNNSRYLCDLGMSRPFICCLTPLEKRPCDTCTIQFREN